MGYPVSTSYFDHVWFCWNLAPGESICLDTPVQFLEDPVGFYEGFDVFTSNIAWDNWDDDNTDGSDTIVREVNRHDGADSRFDYIEFIDC